MFVSADHRMRLFGYKPAPIQVLCPSHSAQLTVTLYSVRVCMTRHLSLQINFVGYPGTSGAPFIDYIVGDAVTTPPEHRGQYSEKVIMLPHSYQVNHYAHGMCTALDGFNRISVRAGQRWSHEHAVQAAIAADVMEHSCDPLSRTVLGLPAVGEGIVLGALNFNSKIEPTVFAAWMAVLRMVPTAVLWLQLPWSHHHAAKDVASHLLREAAANGVHPARLHFANRCRTLSASTLTPSLQYSTMPSPFASPVQLREAATSISSTPHRPVAGHSTGG